MTFKLSDIISNIKVSTATVDIPLDTADAQRFVELAEAAKTATIVEEPRSITDTGPGAEFMEELEELRKRTITVRLRALSSKELSVLRRKVWSDPAFTMKNVSAEEKEVRSVEREERLFEYIIAQACVEVVDNATNETQKGLSFDEAAELRGALPEFLWEKLKETWGTAQSNGAAVSEAISDPTFRGDGTRQTGEPVDAPAAQDGEG